MCRTIMPKHEYRSNQLESFVILFAISSELQGMLLTLKQLLQNGNPRKHLFKRLKGMREEQREHCGETRPLSGKGGDRGSGRKFYGPLAARDLMTEHIPLSIAAHGAEVPPSLPAFKILLNSKGPYLAQQERPAFQLYGGRPFISPVAGVGRYTTGDRSG